MAAGKLFNHRPAKTTQQTLLQAGWQATPRGEDRKRGMTAREGKEQRPVVNNFLEDGPQHDTVAIDATEMSEMPPHRALSVFSAAKLAPKVVYFFGGQDLREVLGTFFGRNPFFPSPSSRRRLPFFTASSILVECCCGSAHLLPPLRHSSPRVSRGLRGIHHAFLANCKARTKIASR